MIRQMVLENFKSYAGAQYVGPFHKVWPGLDIGRRRVRAPPLRCTVGGALCSRYAARCPPSASFQLRCPLQNFSAVVGPNGSGKSNVIDAMLFVFGRRAKQVRRNDTAGTELRAFAGPPLRHAHHPHHRPWLARPPPPQLRFNKVSELIHNSTNHRALERACVTVHFQEIIDRVGRGGGGGGGGRG
jgi:structural maintenance of chromosome 4